MATSAPVSAGDAIKSELPELLQTAVLGESEPMPEGSVPVKGYDFNKGVDLIEWNLVDKLLPC